MNTALYEQSPKDGNVSSRPPSPIRQTFVEPATLSVQSEGFGCNSQPKDGKDSSDSGSNPEWTLGDEGKPFNNGGPTGWTLVEPTKGDTSDDEGSKSIGHSEEACSNCGRTLPRTEVSHSNKFDELEYDNLANVCTACHPSDRWTGKQKSPSSAPVISTVRQACRTIQTAGTSTPVQETVQVVKDYLRALGDPSRPSESRGQPQ